MLESFVQWLLDRFRDLGYPGIVVLMAIESSMLPLPSELVMPPAGYLAAKGELNVAVVVACGVLGSLLGSLANYALARWLGRAFFLRFGRYLLLTERGLDRSEHYFAAHGEISVFMGRMLPVVRHLISIPAGIARMSLVRFVLFTGLGALVWCTILTWIGWFIGTRENVILQVLDQEARRYTTRALLIVLPILALIGVVYVWWYRRRAAPRPPSARDAGSRDGRGGAAG
jgi:membrane protein DedA with SNARE-associated domain